MIESQGCAAFSALQCQPVDPSDAEMICAHRQDMFHEAGESSIRLLVTACGKCKLSVCFGSLAVIRERPFSTRSRR